MSGVRSDFALLKLKEKLQPANNLIAKIAAEEQFITPVVPEDLKLFEDFFGRETRHTYGNSWIYVTQGVYGIGPHNLGYKYYDGDNLCMLSIYPKLDNPNLLMLYWIRPLGKNVISAIAEYANRFKAKYQVASYVKKLFPDQYEEFLSKGFRSSTEFPWYKDIHSEDDTYPELIFDHKQTSALLKNAASRSKLGSALRKTRKLEKEMSVEITGINFEQDAWIISQSFFDRSVQVLKQQNISTAFDYYNMIFNSCYSSSNLQIDRKILLVDGELAGFYVLEHNYDVGVSSVYASLFLRRKAKYIADHFFLLLFRANPINLINLGGSEDVGMHEFKSKYGFIKQQNMYWVTNYF